MGQYINNLDCSIFMFLPPLSYTLNMHSHTYSPAFCLSIFWRFFGWGVEYTSSQVTLCISPMRSFWDSGLVIGLQTKGLLGEESTLPYMATAAVEVITAFSSNAELILSEGGKILVSVWLGRLLSLRLGRLLLIGLQEIWFFWQQWKTGQNQNINKIGNHL